MTTVSLAEISAARATLDGHVSERGRFTRANEGSGWWFAAAKMSFRAFESAAAGW